MKFSNVLLILGYGQYYGAEVPLTLGYLAEALRKHNIQYKIIDANVLKHNSTILEAIKDFSPDLIGVSFASSIMYLKNYSLIETIKNNFSTPIIAGGVHIRAERDLVIQQCQGLDFAMLGESEDALVELCQGRTFKEIKGLYFKENGRIIFSGERDCLTDLDNIVFPKYIGFSSYYKNREITLFDPQVINVLKMPLLTSRGCPYNCIYCSNADHGKVFRFRSPKNVVDEIQYWANIGYKRFGIVDANFTQNRDRVMLICDEIKRRGLVNLDFTVGPRADLVDYELLKEMKSVGFNRVFLNFEGSNNKTLKALNRRCNIDEVERGVEAAFKLKMAVATTFLLGVPGQTWEDIEDIFRLCDKYRFDSLNFLYLTPMRGTPLFEWVTKNNLLFYSPENYLNTKIPWGKIHYETDILSKEKAQKAMKIGFSYRDRYFRTAKREQYAKYGKFTSEAIAIILTFRMKIFRKIRKILSNMRRIE